MGNGRLSDIKFEASLILLLLFNPGSQDEGNIYLNLPFLQPGKIPCGALLSLSIMEPGGIGGISSLYNEMW